jgi:hypothetical protein
MYHVLTCSGKYVMFICPSRHPPSDTGVTKCIHINTYCTWDISPSQGIQTTVHWRTNVTDCHMFYSTLPKQ